MTAIRQASFLGGELAPSMWGRTDSPAYQQGARALLNVFVTKQGSLLRRPGTEFLGRALSPFRPRLVPFVYSESTAYVLEITGYPPPGSGGSLRIWYGSSLVPAEFSSEPMEIPTPYTAGQVERLKFVQSGDVLIITHPEHAPHRLTRLSHKGWTLTPVSFEPWDPVPLARRPLRLEAPLPTEDATHPARNWEWQVSFLYMLPDGSVRETGPMTSGERVRPPLESIPVWSAGATYALNDLVRATVGADQAHRSLSAGNLNNPPLTSPGSWSPQDLAVRPQRVPVYPDRPVTISWGVPGTGDTIGNPPGAEYAGANIYRGRGGVFGYVGGIYGNGNQWWTDYGEEPDYSRPPPQGRNPFEVKAPFDGPIIRTERPACAAYFGERLVFARTNERPEALFASRVGDYDNHDVHLVLLADDAMELRLAARRREEVRSMVPLDALVCLTNGSVWSVSGGGQARTLEATAIPDARVHSETGADWLDPLVVGGEILYQRAGRDGVERLVLSTERAGYVGEDVSQNAQHLLRGHHLVAWDRATAPHAVVWGVREDGALLSLSYHPGGVAAWARHDVGGPVLSLCVVPTSTGDEVWLAVQRGEFAFIERIRHAATDAGNVYLDSHVVRGPSTGTTTYTAAHLHAAAPFPSASTVHILEDGVSSGPLPATSSGTYTRTRAPGVTVQQAILGIANRAQVELLDVSAEKTRNKRVVSVAFEVVASKGIEVGESEERMQPWLQRDIRERHNPTAPHTGIASVNVAAGWNRGARAMLRSSEPCHLEVLAISREVEGGG